MSEKAKEAIEAIVKATGSDPVKLSYLKGVADGMEVSKITADKEVKGNASNNE